jgi:ABC-2 type transport system permease protein
MSRLGLIIQREYLQTVGKKSFILTTLLVPILSILLCVVAPIMLSSVRSNDEKVVAVIDQSPGQTYAPLIKDVDEFHFVTIAPQEAEDAHAVYVAGDRDYYALVVIPASIDSTLEFSIYSESSVPRSFSREIEHFLRPALRKARIESYGIENLEEIVKDCDVNLHVNSVKWDEQGEESISSSELSSVLGLILALAIYMFVLSYGAMIMSGVVEEKTNRIVEVIVSSCKPLELMLGKIIGVALVGFTQFAIWGILLGVGGTIAASIFGLNMSPEMMSPMGSSEAIEAMGTSSAALDSDMKEIFQMIFSIDYPLILSCFVLYFIGGYLLYASLFAAFGSAVDQQQDTSQFMGPIMFFMIFALYAGMFSMENPDGPLAWWCSMIPFTSPITMMVRLPYDVPAWEVILSLGILFVTAFVVLWLAARIYRTGILMYGKKFEWKEVVKWIRQ